MFTKKHLNWLADWITTDLSFGKDRASREAQDLRDHVAISLAYNIEKTQDNFDTSRFLWACRVNKEWITGLQKPKDKIETETETEAEGK